MTAAERDIRFKALRKVGCMCCLLNACLLFQPTTALGLAIEVHHLNRGGIPGAVRRGDAFTFGLCSWHHRGSFNAQAAPGGHDGMVWQERQAGIYGPSWAQGTKRFRPVYGDDDSTLEMANQLVEAITPYLEHET
jgi:hypothetical protein